MAKFVPELVFSKVPDLKKGKETRLEKSETFPWKVNLSNTREALGNARMARLTLIIT